MRNVFAVALRVHQSKLLGMGIGDQLFVQGCSNLQKSCFAPKVAPSGVDPEWTPKYFSRSLVGKSRSLFSLSELFRDSVHWTT